MKVWPPGYVQAHHGQGLIHGKDHGPIPVYALSLTQGLLEDHAQDYTYILYTMVPVHLKIPQTIYIQIKAPVNSKQGKHMIKEAYSCFYVGFTFSIYIEGNGNLGFQGFPPASPCPLHTLFPFHSQSIF